MATELLTGWGRTAATRPARLQRPRSADEVGELLRSAGPRGAIARGLGRAYGDAAQSGGALVLDMCGLNAAIEIDASAGTATVDAGVSLVDLVGRALPLGWFPAVTPGTQFVTVGGAIACDVHGKNHHADGGFAEHVEAFDLVTPAGETIVLDRRSGADAFHATAGGLGLTGAITRATVRLLQVETAWMVVDTQRAENLEDAFERFADDDRYRYSVAWIDCLAAGRHLGRSVLFRGDHARVEQLPHRRRERPLDLPFRPPLAAPPWVPAGLVNRASVTLFNELYFRRAPRDERGRLVPLDRFFYPLDAVRGWNRLYGPRGFVQYQFVVPYGAEEVIRTAIERLSSHHCPSFLAVLKRFGDEDGMISFPMRGWTLALDVPAAMDGLGRLLDALDGLVAESGGRVYLAKDSRLRPELVEAMYPRLDAWREIRARLDPDGVMQSDLSRRLRLAG
jgi:decaprenylphospho-beta-D-ribofuranose 2-oxidase